MVLGGRRLKSDCRAPRRRATRTLAPLPASVTYGNSSTLPIRNTCARENRFLTTSIGNSSGRGRPGGFKTDASGTRDGRQSPNRSGSRWGGSAGLPILPCAFEGRSQSNPPRLVLLDLKLPKIDGLQVLREIKAKPETRAIPVVALTSSTEERDLVESYHLGVNSYIQKPVDFEKFRVTIRAVGIYWATV